MNKKLLLIVLFGLLIRLLLFFIIRPWDYSVVHNKILVSDALEYHQLALGILQSGNFHHFDLFRTPAFPVFLAFIYLLFGIKPWVVLFFHIFLNLISGLLLYELGRQLINQRVALIATGLFFIDPHLILYSLALLTEALFIILLLGGVLSLVMGLKKNQAGFFLFSGLLLGLAALTRPIAQFLPVVGIILIFFCLPKLKQKFLYSFLFILTFMLSLAPWIWKNYADYKYVGLSSIGEQVFFKTIIKQKNFFSPNGNLGQPLPESEKKKALFYMRKNIPAVINTCIYGLTCMYFSAGREDFNRFLGMENTDLSEAKGNFIKKISILLQKKIIHEFIIVGIIKVYLLICYIAFIFGTFFMLKKRNYFVLLFVCSFLVYFTILTGAAKACRYRIPVAPFYLLLSAFAISEISLGSKKLLA